MVSLNEKRSKIRYVVQNKTEWTEGKKNFIENIFTFSIERKTKINEEMNRSLSKNDGEKERHDLEERK